MEIFNQFTVEILIIVFFIITYFFSVFEKVYNWNDTVSYYKSHFKGTFIVSSLPYLLIKVIVFELVTFIFLTLGLYFVFFDNSFEMVKLGLVFSAFTLLLFLIAQRIAKDYSGAMNITVYFILNCFGIFLLT